MASRAALVAGRGAGDARRNDRPYLVDGILRMSMAFVIDPFDLLGGNGRTCGRNSAAVPRSLFLSLPLPLNFPLPRFGGGISSLQ